MQNKPVFILLAGGKSERMGVAKGLLKFDKTFWILEQIQRISKTSIKKVYIGLGYDYQHYFDAIGWFEEATKSFMRFLGVDVKVILNSTPELGSFSTLQEILKVIPSESEILLNPIDTPLLYTIELDRIIQKKNSVVIPSYKGENGHPIKMNSKFWNELKELNPLDNNARLDYQIKKIAPSEISHISVSDGTILLNLNTPKEWKSYIKLYQ